MVMKLTYGHTVKSADDYYLRLTEQALDATIQSGTPASMLADFFPICESMASVKSWGSAQIWPARLSEVLANIPTRITIQTSCIGDAEAGTGARYQFVPDGQGCCRTSFLSPPQRTSTSLMQAAGTAVPSFTAKLLINDASHKHLMDDDDIMGAAAALLTG
jgi:hypothetical protein